MEWLHVLELQPPASSCGHPAWAQGAACSHLAVIRLCTHSEPSARSRCRTCPHPSKAILQLGLREESSAGFAVGNGEDAVPRARLLAGWVLCHPPFSTDRIFAV